MARYWFKQEDVEKCEKPVPLTILRQCALEMSEDPKKYTDDIASSGATEHFNIPHREVFKSVEVAQRNGLTGVHAILPKSHEWLGEAKIGTVTDMPWGERIVVIQNCAADEDYIFVVPAECVEING